MDVKNLSNNRNVTSYSNHTIIGVLRDKELLDSWKNKRAGKDNTNFLKNLKNSLFNT